MDASVLPEICALSISIILFQPIVARAGRHANTWLAGWIFLLLHYVAHVFSVSHDLRGRVFSLIGMASLQAAALCFLRAAGNVHKVRVNRQFTVAVGIPLMVQVVLLVLSPHNLVPHSSLMQRLAVVTFLLPALSLLRMRQRPRPLIGLAAAFVVMAVTVACTPHPRPAVIFNGLQLTMFSSIAALYLAYLPRITRSSIVAVAGLFAWGATFLIAELLGFFYPDLSLHHKLVMVPQFIFVAGIVFSFIEEVVMRAEHLAQHDPLTGLPNARLFEQRATAAMSQAIATNTPLAFLVIDVDEFKRINDTLGHHAGDELLRALAVRLSWHIGPGDMLARTGGDEFTAILAGVADEHHLSFIARAMMSAASVPFVITDQPVDCHISIGIAVAPRIAENIAQLREAADRAMYHAKRNGGSLLAFAREDERMEVAG